MSTEINPKKKRSSSTNPPSDGDHRKRRRNRTTQSCLNCHTSKRMCDRKRPACARCTQLGLTGLCVYEVDDPSQRSESHDENARLLKRVAELEGVVRELKNKPHPRWSQSINNPGKEFDKWNARSQMSADSDVGDLSTAASSPPESNNSSEQGDPSFDKQPSRRSPNSTRPATLFSPPVTLSTGRRSSISQSPYYNSPQSAPSPSLMTPTEEYCQPHVIINSQTDLTQDYELASVFLGYPGLDSEDSGFGLLKLNQPDEGCFLKQHGSDCGCLHELANYNVVLELSIRLRKAADVLARSASHHIGSDCPLNQRISDLDTFATNALGNIVTPPGDLPTRLSTQERLRPNMDMNISQSIGLYGSNVSRTSPKMLAPNSLRAWDLASASPASNDDSFMSWEPPRR